MSRKRKASLRARASEMTRQKVESSSEDSSIKERARTSEEISEGTAEESRSVDVVTFDDMNFIISNRIFVIFIFFGFLMTCTYF